MRFHPPPQTPPKNQQNKTEKKPQKRGDKKEEALNACNYKIFMYTSICSLNLN